MHFTYVAYKSNNYYCVNFLCCVSLVFITDSSCPYYMSIIISKSLIYLCIQYSKMVQMPAID